MKRALVLLALLAPGSAQAATFKVTTTKDGVDASGGDGHCATAAGKCSLRAAVQEADDASGKSTIQVPAGRYTLSIKPIPEAGSTADMDPSNGDLDLSGTVDVVGASARRTIIDGGGVDRVFETGATATVQMTNLTVTGGDSTAGDSQEIDLGGGILNKGALTLERVRLTRNLADGGGGMFTIPGTMPTIRDSLIDHNRALEGGGLRVDQGAHIVNTTITRNRLLPGEITKPVGIVIPTVDEISGYGGGIDYRDGSDLTIEFSTITHNHAVKGGGGIGAGQDYAPLSDQLPLGKLYLRGDIIANNSSVRGPRECRTNQVDFLTRGFNLSDDATCFLTAKTDLPRRHPRLRRLARNGGPLPTQRLRRRSRAINAGGTTCPPTDARGVKRPQGKACDIGAFERRRGR